MTAQKHLSAAFLTEAKKILGPKGWTEDADIITPHLTEWRGKYIGQAAFMATPHQTQQVQALVKLCRKMNVAIVPQGGNTGLVGGGIPGLEQKPDLLLSTQKMDQVIEIDTEGLSLTVEAGVPLKTAQDLVAEKGLLLPLSIASEGSATIGGVCSTNAGGIHVIRYGMTRSLVRGVEAVLGTGDVYNGLTALMKDNTGYALTPLLIGSEGTLGIITKAVFRLYPAEQQRQTGWLDVNSLEAALGCLRELEALCEGRLSAYELISRAGLSLVEKHMHSAERPTVAKTDWSVIFDIGLTQDDPPLRAKLTNWLESKFADDVVIDGVLAQSETQSQNLWHLREWLSEAQKHEAPSIKHDVSLPRHHMAAFLTASEKALNNQDIACEAIVFGHLGDGNLHYNIMAKDRSQSSRLVAKWPEISALVHALVLAHGGSISAEHGIGRMKKTALKKSADSGKYAAMQAIKTALDPDQILNPGVLL